MIKTLFETTPLTAQEKVIVQYIQDHPDCLLEHNAKELAQLTYVSSPNNLFVFVKKLGFQGYHDFQLTYVQEYMLHQKIFLHVLIKRVQLMM